MNKKKEGNIRYHIVLQASELTLQEVQLDQYNKMQFVFIKKSRMCYPHKRVNTNQITTMVGN